MTFHGSLISGTALGGTPFYGPGITYESGWSPDELFWRDEVGAWYDPSDLSTMFRNTAGTQPVTTAGQEVALLLDKSRGLALGPELWADQVATIRNFNGTSGTYDTATKTMGNSSAGGASNWPRFDFNLGLVAGRRYKITITLSSAASLVSWLVYGESSVFIQSLNGVFEGIILGDASGLLTIQSNLGTSVGWAVTISNISVRELAGNHAAQGTLAARPFYRIDAGGRPYLEFDGIDDSLATSAIDFSGTDAVTVFAGVRKASDTARGTIAELTASVAANNGGFHLTAPNAASDTFAFESKGTALTDAVATGIAAPATRILTGAADISADSNILRVNGVQADSDTGDQGTGNYANAALYIGRRGSASLPFNGSLYGLIIRGAASSDAQIRSAERWLARKSGVVL